MTVSLAIILASIPLGGLWRHWFGGAGGQTISALTNGLTSGKTASRFFVLIFTIPAWVNWQWEQALGLSIFALLYASLGQDYEKPLKLLWRYSLPIAALALSCKLWWALPLAPLCPAYVALFRNKPMTMPAWFGNCWWSVGEWILGASSMPVIVGAGLLSNGWEWGDLSPWLAWI